MGDVVTLVQRRSSRKSEKYRSWTMASVQEGAFYGWLYGYYGQHGSWNRKPRSGYKVIFVRRR
jgi:hypothetical protein